MDRKKSLVARALRWVECNLSQFDPTVDSSNHDLRLKALTELFLICSLYKRKFGRESSAIEPIILQGAKMLKKINYIDSMHRKPELVIPYSTIYCSLRDWGVEKEDMRTAIQSLLNNDLPIVTEDNPYRKMEMCYILERCKFKHSLPTLQELYESTSLHNSPPILSLRIDNAYMLTHLIFYLTDFGHRKPMVALPNLHSLHWIISMLLGLYVKERSWDIVAELLMCCDLTNFFPAPFYNEGWEGLLNAQKDNGALPDNFFDTKKYQEMHGFIKGRYYFEQHYHTTMVAAAAGFLSQHNTMPQYDFLRMTGQSQIQNGDLHCRKADAWLTNCFRVLESQFDLPASLYSLIGHWMASDLAKPRESLLEDNMYYQLFDKVQELSHRNSISECDPALILVSLGIFRRLGLRAHSLEHFALHAYDAIISNGNSARMNYLRLFPVIYLLDSLGFDCALKLSYGKKESSTVFANYVTTISEVNSEDLPDFVSAFTSYGKHDIFTLDQYHLNRIQARLTILIFHYLSRYDLNEGLQVIRAMNYAKMRNQKSFEQAYRFLLSQQRENGSFGFYAQEIDKIKQKNLQFNPITKIILPTTVSAMWTIREFGEDTNSLFNSI